MPVYVADVLFRGPSQYMDLLSYYAIKLKILESRSETHMWDRERLPILNASILVSIWSILAIFNFIGLLYS